MLLFKTLITDELKLQRKSEIYPKKKKYIFYRQFPNNKKKKGKKSQTGEQTITPRQRGVGWLPAPATTTAPKKEIITENVYQHFSSFENIWNLYPSASCCLTSPHL